MRHLRSEWCQPPGAEEGLAKQELAAALGAAVAAAEAERVGMPAIQAAVHAIVERAVATVVAATESKAEGRRVQGAPLLPRSSPDSDDQLQLLLTPHDGARVQLAIQWLC